MVLVKPRETTAATSTQRGESGAREEYYGWHLRTKAFGTLEGIRKVVQGITINSIYSGRA